MTTLPGKVVLITGAARGMGKLHAINFAREGSRVIITDVDEEELRKAAGEIGSPGFEVHAYPLDVSDRDACFALAGRVASEVGPVDILVNNAGVVECGDVLGATEHSVRRMVDVNYLGQVWMMQAVVPEMVRRGGGHVVNVCSSAGKIGVVRLGAYCATKFAAIGITDSLRPELLESGVRFTIVNPGFVKTGMFAGAKVPPVARWQEPRKISDALIFAVKRDRAEICVPRLSIRLAALLRALCIPRFTDWLNKLLRANRSFYTWKKDPERPF